MPFFSIIMPVYNNDQYIRRSIDSIIQQSFTDFELIICDDGSTDTTRQICMEYSDERIVFLSLVHMGVSNARNEGIKVSKGMYLVFVDSDDYVLFDFLQNMHKILSKQKVFLITNHKIEKEEKNFSKSCKLYSISSFLEIIIEIRNKYKLGAVWGKVFEGKIIRQNNIKFNSNYSFAEDTLFVTDYLKYVKEILLYDEGFYVYCNVYKNSLSEKRDKNFANIFWLILQNLKYLLGQYDIRDKSKILEYFNGLFKDKCNY